jgi:heme iron utilization protein
MHMESRLDILIDLLHRCPDAALATHSLALPGYPFATALPFATDAQHRPVLLISTLAEHTQNLAADPRASLLVRVALAEGEVVRATVVGNVAPIEAEPLLVERYLRYQPDAERLLQFGDFRFFRLEPVRIRIIGGFGQAGWLDGDRLGVLPRLTLAAERGLLDAVVAPAAVTLLGVDCFGFDLRVAGERRRIVFEKGPLAAGDVAAALRGAVDRIPVQGFSGRSME